MAVIFYEQNPFFQILAHPMSVIRKQNGLSYKSELDRSKCHAPDITTFPYQSVYTQKEY